VVRLLADGPGELMSVALEYEDFADDEQVVEHLLSLGLTPLDPTSRLELEAMLRIAASLGDQQLVDEHDPEYTDRVDRQLDLARKGSGRTMLAGSGEETARLASGRPAVSHKPSVQHAALTLKAERLLWESEKALLRVAGWFGRPGLRDVFLRLAGYGFGSPEEARTTLKAVAVECGVDPDTVAAVRDRGLRWLAVLRLGLGPENGGIRCANPNCAGGEHGRPRIINPETRSPHHRCCSEPCRRALDAWRRRERWRAARLSVPPE
jgi:hypothetical protein